MPVEQMIKHPRLGRRRRIDAAKVPPDALMLLDPSGAVRQLVPAPVAQSLRLMVARLRVGDVSGIPRRIGLTSAIPGEGVSFLATALALLLTHDTPDSVCLVDLNWSAAPKDPDALPGLADVVKDRASLADVLDVTGNPGLAIPHAGTTDVAERPYLSNSAELDQILAELDQEFDHLVIDLPAVRASADALTLAQKANAILFVIRQGVTPELDAKDALAQLQGLPVIGSMLNRTSSRVPAFLRRRIAGT